MRRCGVADLVRDSGRRRSVLPSPAPINCAVARFRDISIEQKLKLITMLASGAALLTACIGLVSYDIVSYRALMVRDLEALAELTAINCELPLRLGDDFKKDAAGYLKALEAEPHIIAACIYGKDGKEFVRYVRNSALQPPKAAPPDHSGHSFRDGRLEVFHGITTPEGERIGTAYLVSDLAEMRARLRTYAASVIFVAAVALGVAFALSSRLQRVISRPLLHLRDTARTVSQNKDFAIRAEKHGNDELGTLIDGFNEMLAQIQQRDEALRGAHDELEKRVAERTAELQTEITERKQAESIVQQQLTRISLLNRIAHAISERQDVHSILSIVLQQLQSHLAVTSGAFYLLNEERQTLELTAVRGPGEGGASVCFAEAAALGQIRESPLQGCLDAKTVYLPGISEVNLPILRDASADGICSVVVVPLEVENKLFGLLAAARTTENAFSSGECEFLKMLSEQVALAGHQAQLYTQLQAAYNELRETQQAVMQHERLRALGQMASGIAHDINNALSPVMGFAELLLRTERSLSPAGVKYIQHIRTSSEDITHIVARLREFYRRRDDVHEMKPVELNALALEVIDLTRPRWRDMSQERGISISIETEFARHLPVVLGIGSELREALTNLILNAVDAMQKHGTITIRTSVSRSARGAEEVVLEVQDDGIGMDAETRKRCLEPFFSTKGARGTGLGLAMVYGIVERHEGRIDIISERGEGTRMRLVFPVARPRSPLPDSAPDVELPLPPLRILFVDDEPLLRQLMRDMLEHEGHMVVAADSGEVALERFRDAASTATPFDVILTDLGMPRLDGRRLAELIKAESPATPIVMLTGWGNLMRPEDERLVVDFLLSKPPRRHEIRNALRQVVCGARSAAT